MNNITDNEKIAFCITCMNRLKHLQQTLEKNIHDNYLIGRVEFILLDYNSQDGLQEWVYNNMLKYIEEGILVYYKTTEPAHYLRSHSRNMAFRLANATILCNLDADNYLGKGFADFMLHEFSNQENIFYTTNYSCDGTYGRICVRRKDFISVRGYNEALQGWGFEDNDFYYRFFLKGIKPMSFQNPEFYHYIEHPDADRIADEYMFKNLKEMYITYINPYTSGILLLFENFTTEQYVFVNNQIFNVLADFSRKNKPLFDDRDRITVKDIILKGLWRQKNNVISIQENDNQCLVYKETSCFELNGKIFYKIQNDSLKGKLLLLLSSAINYNQAKNQYVNNLVVNPESFGKGAVYKNFNFSKKIILS